MGDQLRERLFLAAAGGAHGLAIWLLLESWPDSHTARAVAVSALTFLAVTAAVLHFAWTGRDPRRLAALAVGTGVIYAAVAGWVGGAMPVDHSVNPNSEERGVVWFATSVATLYVLGPFLQIYQHTGRVHFPYRDLFLHGWNNYFVALVGGLFVGALWSVLLLWAALFELIGIELFDDLFTEAAFAWPVSGAATGFGIALGRESERVVSTLRSITLAVFRGLLPLVSVVALIFLASLPFTGLESLWSTNHASQLLLTWVVLTVVFLNAVYQDGSQSEPLPAPIRRLVEAALLGMTVFVGISIYGISLRIGQYGLTPPRMWGLLFAIVLSGYAGGYALAVVRRGEPWLHTMRGVNLFVALLIVALGLGVHTPVLDPIGWSVSSQIGRLMDGRTSAADFDYGYLRFQLGLEGAAGLEALEAVEDHSELAALRDGLARARAAESYWQWKEHRGPALSREMIEVLPPGGELPDGLLDAARREDHLWVGDSCQEARFCAAFSTDLDGREPAEWVLVVAYPTWSRLVVFAKDAEGFELLGRLRHDGPVPSSEGLERELQAMRVRPIEPLHRDLEIGERRYQFVPK